jgi:hypothetical protein
MTTIKMPATITVHQLQQAIKGGQPGLQLTQSSSGLALGVSLAPHGPSTSSAQGRQGTASVQTGTMGTATLVMPASGAKPGVSDAQGVTRVIPAGAIGQGSQLKYQVIYCGSRLFILS